MRDDFTRRQLDLDETFDQKHGWFTNERLAKAELNLLVKHSNMREFILFAFKVPENYDDLNDEIPF